jgi:opacity protein-like surface antigen
LVFSIPRSARSEEAESIAALGAIGALSGVFCWTAALAEGRNEKADSTGKQYTRRGALVGAALAYAHETYESDLESPGVNLSVKDSVGFKGRAGFRCHRYVSAELQVEWLDEFEGKFFVDGVGHVLNFDVKPIVVTVNARGYVPIFGDRVQPFVLLGGGLVTVKSTLRDVTGSGQRASSRETEFAIRAGGGIDFYATPNIVLTLESDYVQAFDDLDDFDYVSVGLGAQYRF